MKRLVLVIILFSSVAYAYVPTVESLFRHGSNPDIVGNGVSITFSVRKVMALTKSTSGQESSLVNETRTIDYYRMFFTRIGQDTMKVSQTRYDNNSFSESSLLEKVYYPNFTPLTIKPTPELVERGIFINLLKSLLFNDGGSLVTYLKALGVPVKLNSEIINREKVEFLASYKRYLVAINSNRAARKTEINPLRPEDPVAREKAETIMSEPMYVDMKQVKISREDGEMAWLVQSGPFEAVISYKMRDVQKVKYRGSLGEIEIICKDYWLANGTHSLPRTILIKDFKGETFQVEISNLRHFVEKEDDLAKRLKKWDELLRGKESLDPKPPFLL
jgi:hypothetical protein